MILKIDFTNNEMVQMNVDEGPTEATQTSLLALGRKAISTDTLKIR